MLVLSSPSGAGKSTISRALLDQNPDLTMSVSATTRPMRPGEVEGRDYYFINQEKFDEMVAAKEFLEHATVFGNSYGTPRLPVMDALNDGLDVLFDVDWQGTQQIRGNALEDLVSIFILPPSIEELERRLRTRAQDTEEVVQSRMAKATSEMSHWAEYDYVIINEDIQRSVREVNAIFSAERQKRQRQVGLINFVRELGVGQ
ncbi:MAG: guanylate kinase [Rhodospirillaceae bacterium]|nr:guanylate kinase [Rhodospirillaceae bacterium]MBT5297948.1 guanylate kinase [Rhodospirillaceae bacterium]MBT5512911.1 guanylate kinase [Rhodospirillaceae bacterium]MBT6086817.1 guanylate kinase [Rhodospirillaceae bacterium]MBT7509133.1 guanylate kinase [Rhodospirillaceae bacterium]